MQRSPTNKDGIYSSQPELASTSRIDQKSFVAVRKRKERSEFEELRDEIHSLIETIKSGQETKFESITKSIEELKLQNNVLKGQNEKIICSNDNIEKKLVLTTELYNELKKSMELLQDDHQKAIKKITALEEQLEEIQRNQRSSFIEISTPVKENENILDMVTKLHDVIGIKSVEATIKQCFRLKKGNKKPILVEYQNEQIRNKVLNHVKKYNTQNSTKINKEILGDPDNKDRVYINEFLTPHARKLLFHARQLQKLYGFKFNWISRGKIYIREKEGDPAILIKSIEQIEDIKSTFENNM